MKSHILLFLVVSILVLSPPEAHTQTVRSSTGENYTIDSWNVTDGLPQGSVTAITQSVDGYLWMGTHAGLVRFDGMRFRTYEQLDPQDMRPDAIVAVVARQDSSVWAGTRRGEVFVSHGRGWTSLYQHPLGVGNTVHTMALDGNGIVWIGTSDMGVLRGARSQDGSDTILTSFVQPDFVRPQVSALHIDENGSLWLGGLGGVANSIGAGIRTYTFSGPFARKSVVAIASDSSDNRWIGFSGGGVYRFDAEVPGYLTDVRLGTSYAFDEVFDAERPYISLAVLMGELVLHEGRFVHRSSDEGKNGDRVLSMHKDKEGNYWFGSDLRGLIRVRPAPFEMIQSATRQTITSIVQRTNGAVYVGFASGGIGEIQGKSLTTSPLSARLRSENIWSLFIDDTDRMWVGTWGDGVSRVNLKDPSSRVPQFSRDSFLGSDVVLAIGQAPDKSMWFGTHDAGVVRTSRGRSTRWTTAEGMPSDHVSAIAFDSVGGVWVGTQAGLVLIQDTLMRVFTVADGLTSGAIRTLSVEKDRTIWIGTQGGGVVRFKNGVFRSITTAEGLFDNTVAHILEGVRGFVWMGSNRGIWRVAKDELNAVADQIVPAVNSIGYGVKDGLLVVETHGGFQPGGLRTSEGDLLFPTMNGVARIRTSELRVNTTPPPVLIERVAADGQEVVGGSTIHVEPGVEDLEITFTALSFTAPEKVRFRYQLRGYNRSWVNVGSERTVVFTNISPGTYVFTVTAANNDGFWNDDGAEVTIIVQTPFWETVWFRGVAVLMLIGMGMLVVSVRLRQVRRQKELQEETSHRLIQSQEQERQRIAGELHDSLGQDLIVAKNRVMLASHHLPEESKARSELTQVADALGNALKSVRSIAYNLRPFQLDRLGLTETIRSTVRTIQQATKVRFETEIENIDGLLDHDGEIGLFRVVQEALTNVVKHSDATYATVVVTRDEDAVVMRITDDGVGFDHDHHHESGPSLGFGLPGMSERVRLLRGMYKINSTPGKGTTVAVRLPVQKRKDGVYG